MAGSAFLEPEWIVLDPSDYEAIRLLKDSAGQFYGGGPFGSGPYGGQGLASAGAVTAGAVDTLWSKPVYISPALGRGTALVGARVGAGLGTGAGSSSRSATATPTISSATRS